MLQKFSLSEKREEKKTVANKKSHWSKACNTEMFTLSKRKFLVSVSNVTRQNNEDKKRMCQKRRGNSLTYIYIGGSLKKKKLVEDYLREILSHRFDIS